jgi:hypothetical protein
MTRISFINELYGQEALKRRQRRDARFINTAFGMTLLGAGWPTSWKTAACSAAWAGSTTSSPRAMRWRARASILLLRSWREAGGEVSSNLFWTYGHCTIPRHLRDIVVTEYGIADLRGQTDSEVIARLLAVSDSRFQPGLIEQAKDAGKLPKTFSWIRALPTTPATPGGDQGAACAAVPGVSAGHGLYGRGAGSVAGAELVEEQVQAERGAGAGQGSAGCAGAGGYERHLERMQLDQPQGLEGSFISGCCWRGYRPPDNRLRFGPCGAGLPANAMLNLPSHSRVSPAHPRRWALFDEGDHTAFQRLHPGQRFNAVALAVQLGTAALERLLDHDAQAATVAPACLMIEISAWDALPLARKSSITSTRSLLLR